MRRFERGYLAIGGPLLCHRLLALRRKGKIDEKILRVALRKLEALALLHADPARSERRGKGRKS